MDGDRHARERGSAIASSLSSRIIPINHRATLYLGRLGAFLLIIDKNLSSGRSRP